MILWYPNQAKFWFFFFYRKMFLFIGHLFLQLFFSEYLVITRFPTRQKCSLNHRPSLCWLTLCNGQAHFFLKIRQGSGVQFPVSGKSGFRYTNDVLSYMHFIFRKSDASNNPGYHLSYPNWKRFSFLKFQRKFPIWFSLIWPGSHPLLNLLLGPGMLSGPQGGMGLTQNIWSRV